MSLSPTYAFGYFPNFDKNHTIYFKDTPRETANFVVTSLVSGSPDIGSLGHLKSYVPGWALAHAIRTEFKEIRHHFSHVSGNVAGVGFHLLVAIRRIVELIPLINLVLILVDAVATAGRMIYVSFIASKPADATVHPAV